MLQTSQEDFDYKPSNAVHAFLMCTKMYNHDIILLNMEEIEKAKGSFLTTFSTSLNFNVDGCVTLEQNDEQSNQAKMCGRLRNFCSAKFYVI